MSLCSLRFRQSTPSLARHARMDGEASAADRGPCRRGFRYVPERAAVTGHCRRRGHRRVPIAKSFLATTGEGRERVPWRSPWNPLQVRVALVVGPVHRFPLRPSPVRPPSGRGALVSARISRKRRRCSSSSAKSFSRTPADAFGSHRTESPDCTNVVGVPAPVPRYAVLAVDRPPIMSAGSTPYLPVSPYACQPRQAGRALRTIAKQAAPHPACATLAIPHIPTNQDAPQRSATPHRQQ